jgi:hypothetical protein
MAESEISKSMVINQYKATVITQYLQIKKKLKKKGK